MSRDIIVAKRYARALFETAKEQQAIAKVEEELAFAVNLLTQNDDLHKLIELPNVPVSTKQDIVKKAAGRPNFSGGVELRPAFDRKRKRIAA